jgi:hypothetical protein
MDGGAAAREKNGANNLEEDDRDNRIPEPIPQARFVKPIQAARKGPIGL